MDNLKITYRLNEADAEALKKVQDRDLKRVKKLLISLQADEDMIDAINQALTDNDRW